jgi:hypothetical protein
MKTRKRKQYNQAQRHTIHRPQVSVEEKSPHKCGHTIHELYYDFTENNELCPNCSTVLKVWAKEQQANRNLDLRLKEYNNSANFEWPPAVSYCAKSLWINVRSKWILESTKKAKKKWIGGYI